jgi:hypothetical protein
LRISQDYLNDYKSQSFHRWKDLIFKPLFGKSMYNASRKVLANIVFPKPEGLAKMWSLFLRFKVFGA